MTDNTAQTPQALNTLRTWRDEFKANLVPSPLEDVSQLSAKLDLTHAHPSGIAQLFGNGSAPLHSLFRDSGMLRAAARRAERVLDDQSAKKRFSGVAELSLVVGVATWKGNSMPVLLYPVEVARDGTPVEHHTTISFTGHVRLNAQFLAVMREHGVHLDERQLFDGSNYKSGTPETAAVFTAITQMAQHVFPDFSIERQIILGCFMDPSMQILVESQMIIDHLAKAPAATRCSTRSPDSQRHATTCRTSRCPHTAHSTATRIRNSKWAMWTTLCAMPPTWPPQATACSWTARKTPTRQNRPRQSLAVHHAGRSVLYVPCVPDQKRRFINVMRANELGGQLLDVADQNANAAIDHQLISAVGYQQGVATSRFDQLADELVGVRSRLTRYLGDLHGVNKTWNVSAYQTIQNLANISELPTHPATHVRLGKEVARSIGSSLDDWASKLERAGELGEYTIGPDDTAWYKASLYTEDEAIDAYQRVVDMLRNLLPATREQVESTVKTCGFSIPTTAQEWTKQVTVLKNLRRVLDVFQPEIFERDIDAMIEATTPKSERKSEASPWASGTAAARSKRRRACCASARMSKTCTMRS